MSKSILYYLYENERTKKFSTISEIYIKIKEIHNLNKFKETVFQFFNSNIKENSECYESVEIK